MENNDRVALVVGEAIRSKGLGSTRTRQSDAGIIGPSDLGFCRQKAALMTRGVEATDSSSYLWAAQVGTAIHEYVEGALGVYEDWLIEQRVTTTFPSGAVVSGTCDIIVPQWNAVLDLKTVDGFENVKRFGTSLSHRYQRHTYALGAIQAGLLDGDKPVLVGNVYLDRSGRNPDPYVPPLEEFDTLLTGEIDQWIGDVIYAVQHNEDASRDVAAPVCEKICEFYGACRGDLPVGENDVIDTEEVRRAVTLYVEGRDAKAAADRQMDEAKAVLTGLNGIAGGYQVRTTEIAETEVPGFTRRASTRLDVRKARGV